MKDQINTIREALEPLLYYDSVRIALTALDQIEADHFTSADMASAAAQGYRDGVASVQQGEPVGKFWQHPRTKEWYQEHEGEPLYRAATVAQQPQAEAVWVNPELEHMAEEAECVSMCLNDRGVPSKDGSKPLSLWGRVEQYANPRFLEGMTTNTPIVSSEHIKTLAQVCRLIGNYTTAEFVQNVGGFAQVLLANKAVQEAFVKANTHLLYAAPQQAEAVPSDVVRDAAPIPDHELVTMYDERPTSDREMIEFAREVERRHGIGVQPQHITDGSPCWCNPDVAYTDPETGVSVIVHRRPQ